MKIEKYDGDTYKIIEKFGKEGKSKYLFTLLCPICGHTSLCALEKQYIEISYEIERGDTLPQKISEEVEDYETIEVRCNKYNCMATLSGYIDDYILAIVKTEGGEIKVFYPQPEELTQQAKEKIKELISELD